MWSHEFVALVSSSLRSHIAFSLSDLPGFNVPSGDCAECISLGRPDGAIRNDIFASLYLYRPDVSPISRNELPLRPEQSRLGAVPMVLKLHYLFTPRSDDDIANQLMLGRILKFVHETSMLAIPENQQTGTHGDTKQFHLSFEKLTLEQMTMLWSSFGVPHCTSLPMFVDLNVNEDTLPV